MDGGGVENETFEYAPLDGDALVGSLSSSPSEKTPEFSSRYSFDNPLYGSVNEDFGNGTNDGSGDVVGDDGDMLKAVQQQSGLNNNQRWARERGCKQNQRNFPFFYTKYFLF